MELKRTIIVEGPDGSGKTTLLRQLSSSLGFSAYHTGGPPRDRLDLQQKFHDMRSRAATHIFDRCPHISEPIYSEVADRVPFISEWHMHERLGVEFNPVIIYCRLKSVKSMFDNIDLSDKPHKPAEHLEKVARDYAAVVKAYDKVFSHPLTGVHVIQYDWENDSYEKLVERIKCAAF